MDGTFLIPLKRKYLTPTAKKIARRDSTTGRRQTNKNGLPSPVHNPPRLQRTRMLVVEAGTGKRRWRWV